MSDLELPRARTLQSSQTRNRVHDGHARFRISDNLRAEAQRRAARDGMSLSELIRAALRRELCDAA